MDLNNTYSHVGIIGAGSFGTALANLISINAPVLIYVRNNERLKAINEQKQNANQNIRDNITATTNKDDITQKCRLIFPVVPSKYFRKMIIDFSTQLTPNHILIHGTKGLDVGLAENEEIESLPFLRKESIYTMSDVILQESVVVRVGCVAGPNLSKEISEGQPAGTVIASPFHEVIELGTKALNSQQFKVFASDDLIGAEFAGVLKNIFAVASGILTGIGYGNNARALLLTKGLHEMLHIGQFMGANKSGFLGIAGIGDLIATCSSELSRNFTVGKRIANGDSLQDILDSSTEVAEGVRTIKIFKLICDEYSINAPITNILHSVLYEQKPIQEAVVQLMSYNFNEDVTFLN